MMVPCFECSDDVYVDEDAEVEVALCPECSVKYGHWEVPAYFEDGGDGYQLADNYQYTEY